MLTAELGLAQSSSSLIVSGQQKFRRGQYGPLSAGLRRAQKSQSLDVYASTAFCDILHKRAFVRQLSKLCCGNNAEQLYSWYWRSTKTLAGVTRLACFGTYPLPRGNRLLFPLFGNFETLPGCSLSAARSQQAAEGVSIEFI